MFTGIIREIGVLTQIKKGSSRICLGIKSPSVAEGAAVSDSIAINGTCLTVTGKKADTLFFDAVASTLQRTNLKSLKIADPVNVEPALSVGEKIGGHFVLGHVDACAKLRRVLKKGDYWSLEVELLSRFRLQAVENGSIALDGVSLTIKKILPQSLSVDIVPFTYNNTTLKLRKPGYRLNVEFDYLLKKGNSK